MGIFERELQKNVRIKERPCNDSSFNQSEPMQPSKERAKVALWLFLIFNRRNEIHVAVLGMTFRHDLLLLLLLLRIPRDVSKIFSITSKLFYRLLEDCGSRTNAY